MSFNVRLIVVFGLAALVAQVHAQEGATSNVRVDASSINSKVMCGYQGWFRCAGDAANQGWIHWSRDGQLRPQSITFEMWPDMREYSEEERFLAPGFTHPDDSQAYLFSSDNAKTVLRHFEWMRDYGIDGAWLQHFVVDLPGGPSETRYPSRLRVLNHVRAAANKTGRVWAITYDIAGMPNDKIFETLTADWKKIVDDKVTNDAQYLHHDGKPVVEIWGFYSHSESNAMTPELGNRLINFFKSNGPYQAYLIGGGDWDWRRNTNPEWRNLFHRFDAYMPWNIGNYSLDKTTGVKRPSVGWWEDDLKECREHGVKWIPVIYPGFSWDNLQKKPLGSTIIPRRKGEFLWEQFHALASLGVDSACVAMFDEVDEGTAIFKMTDSPPTQAHFVGLEGMPSDWYLRLVGEGSRMIHKQRPISAKIPIQP